VGTPKRGRSHACSTHQSAKTPTKMSQSTASVLRIYLYEPQGEKWIRSLEESPGSPERYFRERRGITDEERTSRLEWFRMAHAEEAAIVLVLCCVPFDQPRLITVEH
jgi:hypothetical protein